MTKYLKSFEKWTTQQLLWCFIPHDFIFSLNWVMMLEKESAQCHKKLRAWRCHFHFLHHLLVSFPIPLVKLFIIGSFFASHSSSWSCNCRAHLPKTDELTTLIAMELLSSRRWRLDRPKQKPVVFVLNPENYATHAWHDSIDVWLLGRSTCSSPSTKELLGLTVVPPLKQCQRIL